MADIAITAANVAPTATTITDIGTAGATITAGQTLYADANDSYYLKPCLATTSIATAACVGTALHGASRGQPIRYAKDGDITCGGTVVTGKVYTLSNGSGAFAPSADLDSATTLTWYGTVIGIAISTTVLRLTITPSGVLRV